VLERRFQQARDTNSLDTLKLWRTAHADLRNKALDELVQEKVIADKLMPPAMPDPDGNMLDPVPRAPAPPHELLQKAWYGGTLHWGKDRGTMAQVKTDPFDAGMWEIWMRQAGSDLAHFYMGFALLVEQVLQAAKPGQT
jgi:hypothetical protein